MMRDVARFPGHTLPMKCSGTTAQHAHGAGGGALADCAGEIRPTADAAAEIGPAVPPAAWPLLAADVFRRHDMPARGAPVLGRYDDF